jgi:hypothetical protein
VQGERRPPAPQQLDPTLVQSFLSANGVSTPAAFTLTLRDAAGPVVIGNTSGLVETALYSRRGAIRCCVLDGAYLADVNPSGIAVGTAYWGSQDDLLQVFQPGGWLTNAVMIGGRFRPLQNEVEAFSFFRDSSYVAFTNIDNFGSIRGFRDGIDGRREFELIDAAEPVNLPEPGTGALVVIGTGLVLIWGRRR